MTHTTSIYLAVGLGAALGGVARFGVGGLAARFLGETFPWGTFLVNVLGSTFLGFFAAMTAVEGRLFIPASARAFVAVGLCGGFTTFSTFSLETMSLVRDGELWKASANIAGTLVAWLLGVWCGYMLATVVNQR
jgi:CrcB protein